MCCMHRIHYTSCDCRVLRKNIIHASRSRTIPYLYSLETEEEKYYWYTITMLRQSAYTGPPETSSLNRKQKQCSPSLTIDFVACLSSLMDLEPCLWSSPFPGILNFSFVVRLRAGNRYGTGRVLTGRLAGLVDSSSREIIRFTCRVPGSFSSSNSLVSESSFADVSSRIRPARRGSLTTEWFVASCTPAKYFS